MIKRSKTCNVQYSHFGGEKSRIFPFQTPRTSPIIDKSCSSKKERRRASLQCLLAAAVDALRPPSRRRRKISLPSHLDSISRRFHRQEYFLRAQTSDFSGEMREEEQVGEYHVVEKANGVMRRVTGDHDGLLQLLQGQGDDDGHGQGRQVTLRPQRTSAPTCLRRQNHDQDRKKAVGRQEEREEGVFSRTWPAALAAGARETTSISSGGGHRGRGLSSREGLPWYDRNWILLPAASWRQSPGGGHAQALVEPAVFSHYYYRAAAGRGGGRGGSSRGGSSRGDSAAQTGVLEHAHHHHYYYGGRDWLRDLRFSTYTPSSTQGLGQATTAGRSFPVSTGSEGKF